MISDDQAAAQNWTPEGFDNQGNQIFSLIDEGGDRITWRIDAASGQAFDIANESQAQRDADDAAQQMALTAAPGPLAVFGAEDRGSQIEPIPPPEVIAPWIGGIIFPPPPPLEDTPPPYQPIEPESVPEDFGGEDRGIESAIDLGAQAAAIGSINANSGAELPPLFPAIIAPPMPLLPPLAPAFFPPGAPIDLPTLTPQIVDTPSNRVQPLQNPASPMTAQDYAASRTDLVDNWNRANDPDWDGFNSWLGEWIRSFGSLESYLAADYGGTFSPPTWNDPAVVRPSEFWDDGWRNIGGGRYMLIDRGGNTITFNGDGSGIQNLGQFGARAQDVAANLLQQYNAAHPVVNLPVVTPPPITTTPPIVVLPPPVNGGSGGGGNGGGGGGFMVSPWWDDTHRLIGQTAAGPLYMLIDRGGDIITWIDRGGTTTNLSNAGRATQNAAATAAQLAAQFRAGSGGGGASGGGGGVVNLPPGGVATTYDPTHRLVGYTREGYEVYRLTDEGGNLVEWYDVPGQGARGQHYLSGANDPTSYVFSTARPTTPPRVDNTGGKTGIGAVGGIAIAALLAGGVYLYTRREKS